MSKSKQFFAVKLKLILLTLAVLVNACNSANEDQNKNLTGNDLQNEELFISTMQKHLEAVSNKDLATLKSTLSPEGKMQLILPGSEIIESVDKFVKYHEEWFQDTSWTFETKILNTEIGNKFGIAITEIIYREPERNGKPYQNRMIVSYALEKINDNWYIIKDHASSIEKSEN